jgi:hypothetical protein
MSGVPACPSQKVLQYFLSVTVQLQLGCAHFFVSAMPGSPWLFDCQGSKPFHVFDGGGVSRMFIELTAN